MARVLIIGGLIAVAFWVFSLVDCAVQPAQRHRGVSKAAWVLIVLLLPVIGGVMWFTVGRARPGGGGPVSRRAPDDDPSFIGRLGDISDQDERIRRLEEELAQLDAEDDDPRWNQTPQNPEPDQPEEGGPAIGRRDDDEPGGESR